MKPETLNAEGKSEIINAQGKATVETRNPQPATPNVPKKLLSRKDEITADFLRIMEKHIAELLAGRAGKRYSATDYGGLLFIHPRHLTNTLRLTTGRSTCDFMEERLLLESQKLLTETTLPIADIAQRFAYDDPTNFTKFFKGMAGITPLQYRKKFRV